MGALPFLTSNDAPEDFDPATAPPFDFDAPHEKLVLSPLTLSKGVRTDGMIPGSEPTLDPSQAGPWSTFQLADDEGEKHYVLPTRPGDVPPSGDGVELGDATRRFQQSGEHYGAFDTDERAKAFMEAHTPKRGGLLDSLAAAGESDILAAQSTPAAQRVMGKMGEQLEPDRPLAGFGEEGLEKHRLVDEALKAHGIDPANRGLVQQTASILFHGVTALDQLTKAGLDLVGRATNAALAGTGATVAETLQGFGMEKDEAKRAGDAISGAAEAEMFRSMAEVPTKAVATKDTGLINKYRDVVPVKPDEPTLPGLINTADDLRFQRAPNQPTFYSALERAIEKGDNKAPPDTWLARLKQAPGVKVHEINEVGLEDWIKEQKDLGKKSLTKQEVLDHVQAHNVDIEDVVLGGVDTTKTKEIDEQIAQVRQQKEAVTIPSDEVIAAKDRALIDEGKWQEANAYLEQARNEQKEAIAQHGALDDKIKELEQSKQQFKNPHARFGGYVLKGGGEDYHELLLTLKRGEAGHTAKIQQLDEAKQDAYNNILDAYQSATGLSRGETMDTTYGFQHGNNPRALERIRNVLGPDVANPLLDAYNTAKQKYADAVASRPDNFTESHHSYPNILAHIRFDTRIVNGEKVLHVAEIQSDWHQKGRDRGYSGVDDTPESRDAALQALDKAKAALAPEEARLVAKASEGAHVDKQDFLYEADPEAQRELQRQEVEDDAYRNAERTYREAQAAHQRTRGRNSVPNAPYKATQAWTGLAVKRITRWAAEHGFDRVSFDTGDTNIERYSNLGKDIERITYEPNEDGTFSVTAYDAEGTSIHGLDGNYSAAEAADVFGKDTALSMIEREGYSNYSRKGEFGTQYDLEAYNATRGFPHGMHGFYDKMLPNTINDYLKKWKVKLEDSTVPHNAEEWHINEPYDEDDPDAVWTLENQHGDDNYGEEYSSKEEAEEALQDLMSTAPARSFPVTDKMREDVLQGQPRFQRREGPPPGSLTMTEGGGKVQLVFTPEMAAKRAAVAANLRQRLDQLGLKDVGLRVADAIHEIGQGGERFSQDAYHFNRVINIAMDADNPLAALNHETVHALRALDLFTPKEWALLEKEADRLWHAEHDIGSLYRGDRPAVQAEEAIAFAFAKWAKEGAPQGTLSQRFLQRVQDFFQAVKNGFTGQGFHTPESIFRKIESGEVGTRTSEKRGLINTNDAMTFLRDMTPTVQPPFYSALTRAIEKGDNKAPADVWLGRLQNAPGVKPEEIEWHELKDWLGQQQGKVTKQDLLDHIKERQVELKEVHYGPPDRKLTTRLAHLEQEYTDLYNEWHRLLNDGTQDEADVVRRRFLDLEGPMRAVRAEISKSPDVKYRNYNLPGGQNQRELLLTLPRHDVPIDVADERMYGGGYRLWDNQTNDYQRWSPTNRVTSGFSTREMAQATADAQNAQITGQPVDPTKINFRGVHYREPNVLAHIRFDDRTGPDGEKILHLAEIQSDWHDQGNELGRRTVKNIDEAVAQAEKTRVAAVDRMQKAVDRIVKEASGGAYDNRLLLQTEGTGAQVRAFNALDAHDPELNAARQAYKDASEALAAARKGGGPVGNAPFAKTWPELVMKRMLRYAAENGYDSITWDTGETQGKRYRHPRPEERAKIEEGMKKFYDQRLVWYLNKYADKWKTRVESSTVPADPEGWHITPPDQTTSGQWMVKNNNYNSQGHHFKTEAEARNFLDGMILKVPVHKLVLTDKLKAAVMQGQPLFKRRGLINEAR